MAKTSDIIKFQKPQKFVVRQKNRCSLCGRARAYMRHFGTCRICFRELAHKGELPGVRKASW
jgi:small subunit ribosomal protein S14